MVETHTRQVGRIKTVLKNGTHAFIDLTTISAEGDPGSRFLASATNEDVFLHHEECVGSFYVGMEVSFDAVPDERRGGNNFRAVRAKKTPACLLKELSEGGISLFVRAADGSEEPQDASAFLTWQITSQEILDQLKEHVSYGGEVRLLIVTWPVEAPDESHDVGTETRFLVHLEDRMASISFDTPGRHRLVGLLVFDSKGSNPEDTYLKIYRGRWDTTVINKAATGISLPQRAESIGSGTIDVEIPEGIFAKEPWDSDWVNWIFKTKPRDSCAYNHRRMFAYSVQFVVVALAIVVVSLRGVCFLLSACVMTLVGARNLNWGFLKSTDINFVDIYDEMRWPMVRITAGSIHLTIPVYTTPAILLIVTFVGWVGTIGSPSETMLSTDFLFYEIKTTALGLAIISIIWLVGSLFRHFAATSKKDTWEEERRRRADAAETLVRLASTLRDTNIRKLPMNINTVKFHFAALKQRVCRPFAR